MSRTRQFKVRGKSMAIEEVGNLLAVQADDAAGLNPLDAETVAATDPMMSQPAIEALQHAGWVFVRASESPAGGPVAKVFVKAGGRPVLATNRLTVKVEKSLTEADAEALFAQYGGRVVERLRFAPGLYQVAVEPPPGKDVLDVAAMLDAEPAVEFAEPEFLEVVGRR